MKRGANYSSRKNNIYYSDYQSNKLRSGLLPQGPSQKSQRKAMMQMLFPNQIGIYKQWHTLEARRLCHDLMADPENFVNLFRKLTMNCASWAAYGFPGRDEDLDVVVKIAQEEVYHMSPGSHLVECVLFCMFVSERWVVDGVSHSLFPVLDYLPDFLSPWRVQAKKDYEFESKVCLYLTPSPLYWC